MQDKNNNNIYELKIPDLVIQVILQNSIYYILN